MVTKNAQKHTTSAHTSDETHANARVPATMKEVLAFWHLSLQTQCYETTDELENAFAIIECDTGHDARSQLAAMHRAGIALPAVRGTWTNLGNEECWRTHVASVDIGWQKLQQAIAKDSKRLVPSDPFVSEARADREAQEARTRRAPVAVAPETPAPTHRTRARAERPTAAEVAAVEAETAAWLAQQSAKQGKAGKAAPVAPPARKAAPVAPPARTAAASKAASNPGPYARAETAAARPADIGKRVRQAFGAIKGADSFTKLAAVREFIARDIRPHVSEDTASDLRKSFNEKRATLIAAQEAREAQASKAATRRRS